MKSLHFKSGSRAQRLKLLLAVSISASACGVNDQISTPFSKSGQNEANSSSTGSENAEAETETPRDHIVVPPKEYYDAVLARRMAALTDPTSFALTGNADQVMWVNFNGATLQKGFNQGQSFILCKNSATIPASGLSAAEIDQVLQMVQEHYNKAGAKLIVTPNKPTSGEYTTMHVGGSYRDLGCAGGGVLGIAPFDVGNGDRNDIGFAFSAGVSSVRVIAETVSHEAGHTFGLDHVQNNKDLMYYASAPNIEGFLASRLEGSTRIQDEPAILKQVLGLAVAGQTPDTQDPATPAQPTTPSIPTTPSTPSTPTVPSIPGLSDIEDSCSGLPGLAQIGNIGSLLGGLGAANILDISELIPQLGGVLPGGISAAGGLGGLDKILTIIGIASSAGANQAGNTTTTPATGLGAILNPILAGGILGSTGGLNLPSLISMAGFSSVTSGVSGLQGILNAIGLQRKASEKTAAAALTELPDLSVMLGINTIVNNNNLSKQAKVAELLNGLTKSGRVIAANYQGADREALMSLVKVAYAQAYLKLEK